MRIENVDWQITSRCNRMCPYCFGPNGFNDLSLSDAKRIVDLLAKMGVKQIGFTGGEPLLYPYIAEVIDYVATNGINIYLSSNCDYYEKYANLIKEKVSILGVPLDGALPELHDLIRGNDSFQNVTSAISDICNSFGNIKIKVGTVLVNNNECELENIEKYLFKFRQKILYWKIYELIIYSRNRDKALPLTTDYNCERYRLGQYIGKQKIVFDTLKMRDRSYFFIKPNGDVFVPFLSSDGSYEKDIGNIVNDSIKDIIDTFNEIVNYSGYKEESRYMKNL